jgi:hypothetical protein
MRQSSVGQFGSSMSTSNADYKPPFGDIQIKKANEHHKKSHSLNQSPTESKDSQTNLQLSKIFVRLVNLLKMRQSEGVLRSSCSNHSHSSLKKYQQSNQKKRK